MVFWHFWKKFFQFWKWRAMVKILSYGLYIMNHMYMHMMYIACTYMYTHKWKTKRFLSYIFYSYKLHDVVAIHTLAFGKFQRLFLFVCKVCTYTLKAVKPKSKFKIQIFENVKKQTRNWHVIICLFEIHTFILRYLASRLA